MGTMPVHQWLYPARLLRITDADTLRVRLDLGLRIYRDEAIRLLGVDAPEVRGETRAAGLAAADFVRVWMAQSSAVLDDWHLLIATTKADSFGRFLGTTWRKSDGRCLNADLLSSGHAVPYDGR